MSIKHMTKVCSVAVLVLLVFAALGPGKWIPRSGLGWEIDHFVSYFAFTWMFCLAWPRPLVVGGVFTVLAVVLEGLQAFTPDRVPDLLSALISAGGVLSVALNADVFIRAPRRLNERMLVTMLQRFRLRWPSRNNARTELRRGRVPASSLRSARLLRALAFARIPALALAGTARSLATVRALSNLEIAPSTLRRRV
jgi:hypothetical protein